MTKIVFFFPLKKNLNLVGKEKTPLKKGAQQSPKIQDEYATPVRTIPTLKNPAYGRQSIS